MSCNDFSPYPLEMDDETPAARVAAAIAMDSSSSRFYDGAAGPRCSPAAVAAIARTVEHDYGSTGYTLTIVGGNARGAVGRVEHYDGSRFLLAADCHENVRRVPEPGALACPVPVKAAAAA